MSAAAIAWHASRSRTGDTERAAEATGRAGVILRIDGSIDDVETILLDRLTDGSWQVGDEPPIVIDDAGLPLLPGGVIRPLELE